MAQGTIVKITTEDGVRWRVRMDMVDPETGKRRRPQRTFRTRRDAEVGVAEWRTAIARGTAVLPSATSLTAYLEYWLDTVARHRVRATTYASYQQIARHRVIPTLGGTALQKLTPTQVQALYARLLTTGRIDGRARQLSPRSVRYTHAVLRMALKDAVRLGLVARNVCDMVTPPRASTPPVQYWNLTEVQHFFVVARADALRSLWTLALHTGMRRGELLGLRWGDVDLDRAVLHVRQALTQSGGVMTIQEPKTRSGRRTVALDGACVSALREQRAKQVAQRLKMGLLWEESDLVFTTDLGHHLQPSNVNRRFLALAQKAGVRRIPFHGMRHTHATLLMKNGVHPKVASERLGHANIGITLATYSHVLPDMQQQAAATFAEAITSRKADGIIT